MSLISRCTPGTVASGTRTSRRIGLVEVLEKTIPGPISRGTRCPRLLLLDGGPDGTIPEPPGIDGLDGLPDVGLEVGVDVPGSLRGTVLHEVREVPASLLEPPMGLRATTMLEQLGEVLDDPSVDAEVPLEGPHPLLEVLSRLQGVPRLRDGQTLLVPRPEGHSRF